MLQYTAHFLIIKFSSKIISQVATVFSNPPTLFTDTQSGTSPRVSPRLSKDSIVNSSSSSRPQLGRYGGSPQDHRPSVSSKAFLNEIKEDVNNGAGRLTLKFLQTLQICIQTRSSSRCLKSNERSRQVFLPFSTSVRTLRREELCQMRNTLSKYQKIL